MNADMKWLDNPEVFRVNQLDAHSDHCYYMDYADMEKSENPLMQSLNGQWEIAFSKNVMDRPENLYEENFDAFSNGYALLIQAIGAELDTVFKEFCGFNTTDRKTVADYAQYILTNTPDIKNQKISVQEYDIEIQPFMNWDITQPAQSLQWWGAFTDVKHNRYEQLKQAKQENVLNILGALYLIEMLYLKKITDGTDEFDVFDESSNLFSLKNWTSKAVPLSQAFAVLSDMMDDENNTTNKKFDA